VQCHADVHELKSFARAAAQQKSRKNTRQYEKSIHTDMLRRFVTARCREWTTPKPREFPDIAPNQKNEIHASLSLLRVLRRVGVSQAPDAAQDQRIDTTGAPK